MDMDQSTLKEMGVTKIGDRVRIGAQAKQFRNVVYRRTSKRTTNRVSFTSEMSQGVADHDEQNSLAMLDGNSYTPPSSSGSPRALHSNKGPTSRADKRISRHGSDFGFGPPGQKSSSRPSSPMVDQENRNRVGRHNVLSPTETKGQASNSYFGQPSKPGLRLLPSDTAPRPELGHLRSSPSVDNLVLAGGSALPTDKPLIRVIYAGGTKSVINIDDCQTAEEIIIKTLKKGGGANEHQYKSHCFYLLDGIVPDPKHCRRLGDTELIRICSDRVRGERGRLMIRKIHAGEPEGEQLRLAAKIAEQEGPSPPIIEVQKPLSSKSQQKIERLMGEPLAAVSYPMSPASALERERNVSYFTSPPASIHASARARKLEDFYGARPPTEFITQDLTSYFPDVEKEQMDKTVRMSIRRSRRLSRAASRLSTVSNFSIASSLKDAPPLPTIADNWLGSSASQRSLRPLSVVRLSNRPSSAYRDSITSSMLEPLDEESPLEPNRKSYVSFGADSGSDSTNTAGMTDPENATIMQSYFDDTGSSPGATENGESLNTRLSQFIAEDSEEDDEELMEHLETDSWENLKYMKGAMIGQGSFGTVYLALHAITGELMALKQVEMPSSSGSHLDAKKNNMVEALKREIGLLKELKHPNIVQYLGSNSDDTHLNIFLEYVAGGSVATMLVNYGSLGEALISNFVRQILTGLAYLHSKDIIHRDIKGANILVDNHGSVKISDFGISKRVEASTLLSPSTGKRGGPRVSLQGSVFWMAPEVVKQTAYTRKADIWSLGCLIVEMFTGSHPHPNCTQLQAIFKIGNSSEARPDMPENASAEAKEFLERTFEIEHEKRPSADELLSYAFCAPKA